MNIKTTIISILMLSIAGCATTSHRGNAIRDRLEETPGLATHNISIDESSPGMVTLNGSVSSDRDRNTIERVASSTKGVKEVRNNLVVDPSHVAVREGTTTASYDQRNIISKITNQFADSPELRNYHINVSASDDYVTLRGEVGTERERAAAERIARDTRGVNSVRNEISIANTTRNDRQISQYVREVLARETNIDLRNVDISTTNAIVTLRGSQHSSHDIDNLVSTARSVEGVRDVRNEMTVMNDRYYNNHY